MSWKVTLPCTRLEAELLGDDLPAFAAFDPPPVLVTSEPDEARPEEWQIDAYFDDRPDAATVALLHSMIPTAKRRTPAVECLADADWVTISQAGIEPVQAGRFFVHTGHNAEIIPAGRKAFEVGAGLAFGTGTHATTSGCLMALDRLKQNGKRFDHIADIGTGTGLLAFAALHLWQRAHAIASDIDPVSVEVAADNAEINGVALGQSPGRLSLVTASGTAHPLIARRAPYDLLIANILAGPLIELAPTFGEHVADGGTLVLAGLIRAQASRVARAYARQGFRPSWQIDGEWPVLVMTMRQRYGHRRPRHASARTSQPPGDFGTW